MILSFYDYWISNDFDFSEWFDEYLRSPYFSFDDMIDFYCMHISFALSKSVKAPFYIDINSLENVFLPF